MHAPVTGSPHLLRTTLREARRAIAPAQRIKATDHLARHLLALPFAPTTGAVAGYWAIDGEIALDTWQAHLPAGVQYCLPVLHENGVLRFAPYLPGTTLRANRFGIAEPDVPDSTLLSASALTLAVLPVVGFDVAGHRLGMGGGWYDRSFAFRKTCTAPPYLVGAAFAIQEIQTGLTPQPWDVPLDAVCCEDGCRQME